VALQAEHAREEVRQPQPVVHRHVVLTTLSALPQQNRSFPSSLRSTTALTTSSRTTLTCVDRLRLRLGVAVEKRRERLSSGSDSHRAPPPGRTRVCSDVDEVDATLLRRKFDGIVGADLDDYIYASKLEYKLVAFVSPDCGHDAGGAV
jgi:hypothetical protein